MTDKTPAQEVDVAEVARGLTKASYRALMLLGEDWVDEGWGKTLPNPNDVYSLYWGRNRNLGLVECRLQEGTGVIGRAARYQWRLPPLGLRVRHHLTGEQNDG